MEDIKVIREEFKKYLYKQVADNKLSKVDADTQYSDADYIRKHEDDLLISYYSIFISNERFEQALLNLKKQFQNQGKSDSTFYAYKRALNSYKMFFEEYIKDHLKVYLAKYFTHKSSPNYDEQYKYDYFAKNSYIFDDLNDLSEKFIQLGSPNFVPYVWKSSMFRHLAFKHSFQFFQILENLFNETLPINTRIEDFRKDIKEILLKDSEWNNKDMIDPSVESASFFLSLKYPNKYLLFTRIKPYTNFSKDFHLGLEKFNNENRYIAWIDYCKNNLIPLLNNYCNSNCNLLDCQDFIWFVFNQNKGDNMSLKEKFIKYVYDVVYKSNQSYLQYGKKIENLDNVILNLTNKQIYEIQNSEELSSLLFQLKKISEWQDYNHKNGNGIPYAILNTHYRKFIQNNVVKDNSMKQEANFTQEKIYQPLNQILYGPPGTGKTYNTIIEAMKILTFEGLFRDWYIKVYCQNNKVDSKEKTLNDYIKYLTKINEEFLKNDNIFRYHDLSKFVETKSYILNSKYITEDPTKNNKNSYYQHGLKRYEEFLEWLTYDKIKEKYAEYKNLGQIEFVTFHQSYSYEEFVEGIKPDLNSDDLKYILNKGSFRTICDSAKDLQKAKQTYKFNYSNLSLYKILMPYNDLFEYCIENDCVAIGWGEDVNIENCNSEKDLSSAIPENYEHRKQCISQLNMFKLWIDKDLKEGKDVIAIIPGSMNTIKGIAKITGNYSYNAEIENGQQQRKAEWLKKDINIPSDYIYSSKFVSPTITGMFKDKINEDNLMKLLNNASDQKSKNAVLIIDEINRGNISKIFGELITLIEEDKRDNMEVTLPYSKLPFSVPNNLYIIGTMNTSDRSIASIDIALRRRFKFKEMMPNSSLVADFGIGFNKIFDDLNNKIKLLLDRDHQIGHSYFINTKYNNNNENNNVETLKDIWFSEILPLLNEYFYCDWEKLKLIIPGFIKKLDVPEDLKNECDDSIYEFKTFDEIANFEKALNQEKFEQV